MLRSNLARQTAAALLSALVVQASGLPYFSAVSEASDAPGLVILPFAVGDGAPGGANARVVELLSSELRGRPDELRLVDLPSSAAPAATAAPTRAGPPSGATRAQALAELEKGQGLLSDLRFEHAAVALRSGIDALTAAPEAIAWDALIEAYISLAVALFRMGDEDGASAALLSVVRLAPGYRLPEGRYPPIFVREFEKARRRAEKLAGGTVAIDGPPGSTAFLDGQDLGMVPVLQDRVVRGTHYVKVEGTRGEVYGEAVEVKTGVTRVKATFPAGQGGGDAVASVGGTLDQGAIAAAEAACRAAGAGYALVGVIFRKGEHQLTVGAALFSLQRRAFTALDRYDVDEDLLTANVEIFKMADEISDAMADFPPAVALPLDLADGAGFKSRAVAAAPREIEVTAVPARRSALSPGRAPVAAAEPAGVTALRGTHVPGERLDPDADPGTVSPSAGPAWWVWAIVGAGVAAAAGGTYYGVSQATRPVTGTVSAKW